jgi:hypothetical protein
VQGGQDGVEFWLVGLLSHVEFDDPALEDGDEVEDEGVVGLLLLACGETGVDGHFIYIYYYQTNMCILRSIRHGYHPS